MEWGVARLAGVVECGFASGVHGQRVASAIWAIKILGGPGFGSDAGALGEAGVGVEAARGEI